MTTHPDTDMLRVSDLSNQGYTSYLLWHSLGPPKLSLTSEPFPQTPSKHFYHAADVHQLASSRKFHALRLCLTLKRAVQLHTQTSKLDAAIAWARSAHIQTDFPNITIDDLVQTAVQDRLLWQDPSTLPFRPDEAPLAKLHNWAYTYLKHQFTNYNDLCDQINGAPCGHYAYAAILHRVNVLILDAFPLHTLVHGDNGLDTKTCHQCGRTTPGIFNGHYWQTPPAWYSRGKKSSRGKSTVQDFCSAACILGIYPSPDPEQLFVPLSTNHQTRERHLP